LDRFLLRLFLFYWLCIVPSLYIFLPPIANNYNNLIEAYLRESNRAFLQHQHFRQQPSPTNVSPLLAIGTRIHLHHSSGSSLALQQEIEVNLRRYQDFISGLKGVNIKAYLAVDGAPTSNTNLFEVVSKITSESSIHLISVSPWYNYVAALNAILEQAARDGASLCLFISAEVTATPTDVQTLLNYMDDSDTLVAGAVLPGHDHHPGTLQSLTGTTTPWNTLAVWNVAKMGLTGFPLVADGIHWNGQHLVDAGVEEVSAIALVQSLLGSDKARAKLVPLPHVKWHQDFSDMQRHNYHEEKMKTKLTRADIHLKLLGKTGVVEHL
jgi:hypothetical protein